MKKWILILVLSLGILKLAYGEENIKFEFLNDFISSLRQVKIIFERNKQDDPANRAYNNDVEMGAEFMKNSRLAIKDYEIAKYLLEKYKDSSDETIKSVADAATLVYEKEIELQKQGLSLMEKMYGREVMNNPEDVDFGKLMSEQSILAANHEDLMKMLMDVAVLSTYTIVKADEYKKMTLLDLNAEERDYLIKELILVFGDEVKDGLKVGQSYFTASGAAIMKVISNPDLKTAR